MTDLLTRIRAYVAAIPTHQCQYCDEKFTPMPDQNWCPNCESIKVANCRGYKETQADALLREVAALQPKAYLVHDGRIFVDAAYIKEDYALERVAQRKDGATLSKLYTFTGATHD